LDADLALMRRIDELHLEYPFAGSRMLRGLRGDGREVGRLHVSTLMKKMAITALCRRPNTSKPAPGHKVYPYLLRNVAVTRPTRSRRWISPTFRWPAASSLWPPLSTGSAASPWPGGYRSRCRPTSASKPWKKRSTATAGLRSSLPTRGSQFTSIAFIKALKDVKIAISKDGKGAWRDNVFVERLSGGR
jgi:putative transposase